MPTASNHRMFPSCLPERSLASREPHRSWLKLAVSRFFAIIQTSSNSNAIVCFSKVPGHPPLQCVDFVRMHGCNFVGSGRHVPFTVTGLVHADMLVDSRLGPMGRHGRAARVGNLKLGSVS
jgi:hypothetical protein